VPTLTYVGRHYERRRPDGAGTFIRGEPLEVTDEWLAEWYHRLPESHFLIDGHSVTFDKGADNIPDDGWSRKDIMSWLSERAISRPAGYVSKTAALKLVQKHLTAPAEEAPPVEEPVVEEEVNEPEVLATTVGSEE